ncbi:hypothetical protein SVAN01_04694 [Stagonosporopsis vannaccii]|nr:hypothetical protein SVAN01_04694 [Stagonosporopsis vannaccii]
METVAAGSTMRARWRTCVGKSKNGEGPTQRSTCSHTAASRVPKVALIGAAACHGVGPPHLHSQTTQPTRTKAFALPGAVALQRCIVERVVGRTCR